ncbi:hypothetical protein ACOME3_000492 [Neoechinorhynchus agilis]
MQSLLSRRRVPTEDAANGVRFTNPVEKPRHVVSLVECQTIRTNMEKTEKDRRNRQHCLSVWNEIVHKSGFNDITDEVFKAAFTHIDRCLLDEAKSAVNVHHGLKSGSCAISAYLNGDTLVVAGLGDCMAIIASISPDDDTKLQAQLLIEPHTSMNIKERERVFSEHPEIERCNILYQQRLLGYLAPLRSFGDLRLKASLKDMQEIFVPALGNRFLPKNYETPPYLTAIPETRTIKLTKRDMFLILCTDGVSDKLYADDIVGAIQSSCKFDGNQFKSNQNIATDVLKHVLTGSPNRIDQTAIIEEILHPHPRRSRDDMTIIVVKLPWAFNFVNL